MIQMALVLLLLLVAPPVLLLRRTAPHVTAMHGGSSYLAGIVFGLFVFVALVVSLVAPVPGREGAGLVRVLLAVALTGAWIAALPRDRIRWAWLAPLAPPVAALVALGLGLPTAPWVYGGLTVGVAWLVGINPRAGEAQAQRSLLVDGLTLGVLASLTGALAVGFVAPALADWGLLTLLILLLVVYQDHTLGQVAERMRSLALESAKVQADLARLSGGVEARGRAELEALRTRQILHDLRNLHACVAMNAAWLEEEGAIRQEDPEVGQVFMEMRAAAEDALRLLDDMLPAGRKRAKRELVPLSESVRRVQHHAWPLLRDAGASLVVEGVKGLEGLVPRGAVEELLLNLVLNAVQAGSEGSRPVRVQILAERTLEGSSLWVIDDGPGVRDHLSEKIFEMGFTSRGSAGSGFGLASARRIARDLGGELSLGRRPGSVLRGAAFVLTLPELSVEVTEEVPAPPTGGEVREAAEG